MSDKREILAKVPRKLGRKPEVTVDQVIEAGNVLLTQGRKITGNTLRDYIGFGGTKYLESVWEEHGASSTQITEKENNTTSEHILPPELEDQVKVFIGDVAEQISQFANRSDALANQIAAKKARSAYETMMQNNKSLVEEQDLATKLLEKADAENDELSEALEKLQEAYSDELNRSSSLDNKLTKERDDSQRLKNSLKESQTKLSEALSKISDFEKQVTKIETRLEDALADKKESTNEIIRLNKELNDTQTKLKLAESSAEQLHKEMTNSKNEFDQKYEEAGREKSNAILELNNTRTELAKLKEEFAATKAKLDAQQTLISEKDKRMSDLESQIKKQR